MCSENQTDSTDSEDDEGSEMTKEELHRKVHEHMEIGESLDDPVKMYKADANTTPINLADVPAISVPIEDEPVGMQIVGPKYSEKDLLEFAEKL